MNDDKIKKLKLFLIREIILLLSIMKTSKLYVNATLKTQKCEYEHTYLMDYDFLILEQCVYKF